MTAFIKLAGNRKVEIKAYKAEMPKGFKRTYVIHRLYGGESAGWGLTDYETGYSLGMYIAKSGTRADALKYFDSCFSGRHTEIEAALSKIEPIRGQLTIL